MVGVGFHLIARSNTSCFNTLWLWFTTHIIMQIKLAYFDGPCPFSFFNTGFHIFYSQLLRKPMGKIIMDCLYVVISMYNLYSSNVHVVHVCVSILVFTKLIFKAYFTFEQSLRQRAEAAWVKGPSINQSLLQLAHTNKLLVHCTHAHPLNTTIWL